MKVAIITDMSSWYSEGAYLNELEKKLRIKGITPKIFLITGNAFYEKTSISSYLLRVLSLTKIINKLSKFDIIHVQFAFPLGFGCSFLKFLNLLRKPVIIHTHGVDVFTVPNINYGLRRLTLGKLFTDFAWNKADLIITTCEKAKNEIFQNGIDDKKIKVLYNGIDEKLFQNCSNNIQSEVLELKNPNDLLFLNVASIVPVKNHEVLIRIIEKISKKYRTKYPIKLAIIGKDYTKSFPKKNSQNILWLGPKKHQLLKNYYSISDLFILPSLSEGHPWSMLEAMSCELPIIASNVGGIPETINDPRFLIDPNNEEDIINKISNIIEMDKNELKKIGSLNRKKILEKFTMDHHVKELENIYNSVS